MPSANDDLVQSFLRHAVDLEKFKAGERTKALRVLKSLEDDLMVLLAKNAGSTWTKARLRALLMQVRETIATAYGNLREKIERDLASIADVESSFTADSVNGSVGANVLSVEFSPEQLKAVVSNAVIEGGPQAEWWSRQATKTEHAFADTVRKGILSGTPTDAIVSDLRGNIFKGTLRRNVEALVRTSIAAVADQARSMVFEKNADVISEVMQHSTLDSRTTIICRAYSGKRWRLPDYEPVGHDLPYNNGCPRHWNCLPGDSLVTASPRIASASKRWFDGDVFVIHTTRHGKLTCTPNHQILTVQKWLSSSELHVGMDIVCYAGSEFPLVINGNRKDAPASLEHIAETFWSSPQVLTMPMPLAAENLDGNFAGREGQIAIVGTNRKLWNSFQASPPQHPLQFGLKYGASARTSLGTCRGHLDLLSHRFLASSSGIMRSGGKSLPLVSRRSLHTRLLLFATIANRYAELLQEAQERPLASLANNASHADSSAILPDHLTHDRITRIEINSFHGYVYNLETQFGWYCVNGIVTHNCRSVIVPVVPIFSGFGSEGGAVENNARAERKFRQRLADKGMEQDDIDRAMMNAQASMDGYVPEDLDYEDWLRTKPEAFQIEVLGPGRWKLWNEGKLTFSEMVDQSGDPLTLAELKKQVA